MACKVSSQAEPARTPASAAEPQMPSTHLAVVPALELVPHDLRIHPANVAGAQLHPPAFQAAAPFRLGRPCCLGRGAVCLARAVCHRALGCSAVLRFPAIASRRYVGCTRGDCSISGPLGVLPLRILCCTLCCHHCCVPYKCWRRQLVLRFKALAPRAQQSRQDPQVRSLPTLCPLHSADPNQNRCHLSMKPAVQARAWLGLAPQHRRPRRWSAVACRRVAYVKRCTSGPIRQAADHRFVLPGAGARGSRSPGSPGGRRSRPRRPAPPLRRCRRPLPRPPSRRWRRTR